MKFLIYAILGFYIFPTPSHAGFIRDLIKDRVKSKLENQPAPTATISSEDKITKPGDYTISFSYKDHVRWYKIHIPKKYDPTKPTPLLFALHGGGGDMNTQAQDKFYKQISKSEAEGYVVVFPNGFSPFQSGKLATWNAGGCCAQARDQKIDDVGFIREIINKVKNQLNIDSQKIFSTGMSNGGMMSYRLACELSEVFKGIAAVAGTDNTFECNPKNPISILHIHAKNDDHVLFDGGLGPKAISKAAETEFTSVTKTIAKWVKINGCPETPQRVLTVKGAYCDLYSPCKSKTEVKLCVTDEGGHSWPGGEKPRGGGSSQAISANDILWDFFKSK